MEREQRQKCRLEWTERHAHKKSLRYLRIPSMVCLCLSPTDLCTTRASFIYSFFFCRFFLQNHISSTQITGQKNNNDSQQRTAAAAAAAATTSANVETSETVKCRLPSKWIYRNAMRCHSDGQNMPFALWMPSNPESAWTTGYRVHTQPNHISKNKIKFY